MCLLRANLLIIQTFPIYVQFHSFEMVSQTMPKPIDTCVMKAHHNAA